MAANSSDREGHDSYCPRDTDPLSTCTCTRGWESHPCEPRGCPTPGACSAAKEIERLSNRKEHLDFLRLLTLWDQVSPEVRNRIEALEDWYLRMTPNDARSVRALLQMLASLAPEPNRDD